MSLNDLKSGWNRPEIIHVYMYTTQVQAFSTHPGMSCVTVSHPASFGTKRVGLFLSTTLCRKSCSFLLNKLANGPEIHVGKLKKLYHTLTTMTC
jgi:hypothetical protein